MRPLRPRPADFRATFLAGGWPAIQERYRANSTVARRWVNEEGRDVLLAERAEYRRRARAARGAAGTTPAPERIEA